MITSLGKAAAAMARTSCLTRKENVHNLDPVEVVYFTDQGGVPLIRNGDVVQRPADPDDP